jgi:hypothetical protein
MEYLIADLLDPSLLSLPSLHGFSRGLWEHQLPVSRRPYEPVPQLAFLGIEAPAQSPSLLEPVPLADLVHSSVNKESGLPEEDGEGEAMPPPVATDHSVVQVLEPIGNRQMLQPPDLPAIESNAPLRQSRVRIAVGADGVVRYAILDRSTGSGSSSSEADARALASARRIRFDPQLGGDDRALAWGVLRFVWATSSPPASTNEARVAAP